MPGINPLVSHRLTAWLQTSDEKVLVYDDPVDELIAEEGLKVTRFVHFRALDLFLVILPNRRMISRLLSAYSAFGQACDNQLLNHTLTEAGIHWPAIDIDLSLLGFLREEALLSLRHEFSTKKAA